MRSWRTSSPETGSLLLTDLPTYPLTHLPPRPRLGPCYLLTYPLTHLPTYLLARDWVFVHLGVENVEVALGEMVEDLVQQLLVMVARALDHAYLLVVLEVVLAGLR